MNKFLYGSICLSDIPQELITISQKNGKKYINIAVSERKEVGKFGDTHNISVSVPKDQRKSDDKPIYIGNLKTWNNNESSNVPQQPTSSSYNDDVPF